MGASKCQSSKHSELLLYFLKIHYFTSIIVCSTKKGRLVKLFCESCQNKLLSCYYQSIIDIFITNIWQFHGINFGSGGLYSDVAMTKIGDYLTEINIASDKRWYNQRYVYSFSMSLIHWWIKQSHSIHALTPPLLSWETECRKGNHWTVTVSN